MVKNFLSQLYVTLGKCLLLQPWFTNTFTLCEWNLLGENCVIYSKAYLHFFLTFFLISGFASLTYLIKFGKKLILCDACLKYNPMGRTSLVSDIFLRKYSLLLLRSKCRDVTLMPLIARGNCFIEY